MSEPLFRGNIKLRKGDLNGAMGDYNQAIRNMASPTEIGDWPSKRKATSTEPSLTSIVNGSSGSLGGVKGKKAWKDP